MKTLRTRKIFAAGVIALLLLFVAGIFALGGISTVAYAQDYDTTRNGYTVDDIR